MMIKLWLLVVPYFEFMIFVTIDFKKEQIVRQIGINLPELNVPYRIENVSVAACSEVKQNKNNSNCFNQKYLVAFPLKH